MHEIITLQLGQQSNYLATHFWNAQECYFTYGENEEPLVDHDIHWRPGIGADGTETYLPRTVIYDLKGGFGTLRKVNALYEAQDGRAPESLWSGQTVLHRQAPIEATPYQRSLEAGLEPPELTPATVRYWSDFNRVFFHPRSAVQLSEYELGSSLQPFERWATGGDLFADLDREHDIVDRDLRPFVEEADQMQGIQVFAGLDDAWGGFASCYLERLRDEYGKAAIWLWGLQGSLRGLPYEQRLVRLANKAHTLTEVYKTASLVVPMAMPQGRLPPNVSLDASSAWHTSALLATAVESVTLPSRLKHRPNLDTLETMGELLNVMGRQSMATLQLSVYDPASKKEHDRRTPEAADRMDIDGDDGEDKGEADREHLDMDFAPPDELAPTGGRQNGYHARKKYHLFGETLTIRGEELLDQTPDEVEYERENVIRRRHAQESVSQTYRTSLAFPLPDSFPRIYLDDEGRPLGRAANVRAALATDSSVADRLRQLRTTVSRSIGLEDREALGNDLAQMADEYHEGWSSGSDEGDDE